MTPLTDSDQLLLSAYRQKSKIDMIDTIGLLLTKAIQSEEPAAKDRLFHLAKVAIDELR